MVGSAAGRGAASTVVASSAGRGPSSGSGSRVGGSSGAGAPFQTVEDEEQDKRLHAAKVFNSLVSLVYAQVCISY